MKWKEICYVLSETLQEMLDKSWVVLDGLGKFEGFDAKIHVDPGASP